MEIKKKLTKVNFTPKNDTSRIKYIVMHGTGNDDDTALNNADYFYSEYWGASAHYFVDENEIYQVVKDCDIAWHCGTKGTYNHLLCRNENSIGVEMCNFVSENQAVRANTIELVKSLMDLYNVPIENVLRHYDVTGKNCPAPYVSDESAWNNFKSSLVEDIPLDQKYTVEDCTQQLFWDKIISDRPLWNDKAYADTDIAWVLLKFYDYRLKNGGSVKLPLSIDGVENAVNILNKQGIISDGAKWIDKANDEDVKWLLIKMADYIN